MSEQASGANGVITISGAETTPGQVPAVPAGQILPFDTESLARKTEQTKSNVRRSNRSGSKPILGNRTVDGNIKTELNPNMARLFTMGFGSVATSGAGAYAHTFKIGDALPYHTIEKGFTDLSKFFRYLGCKCNKFGFELGPSGILPLDMDFMGLDREIQAATFDAAALDLGHNPFEGFEGSIKEGAAAIGTITSMKWALENNLDGGVYCIGGGGKRYNIPDGITVVSGSVTALFDSDALLQKAIAGDASSLEVTLFRGDGSGSADNESLVLSIDELIYQEQDPIIKDDKGILIELPWTAYWNTGANGTSVQAVLKNTQASAA